MRTTKDCRLENKICIFIIGISYPIIIRSIHFIRFLLYLVVYIMSLLELKWENTHRKIILYKVNSLVAL